MNGSVSEPTCATVTKVCGQNELRPYAVTSLKTTSESVTFSLVEGVWDYPTLPLPGEQVMLYGIVTARRGRRATRVLRSE